MWQYADLRFADLIIFLQVADWWLADQIICGIKNPTNSAKQTCRRIFGGFATKAQKGAQHFKRDVSPFVFIFKKLRICDKRTGTPIKFANLRFADLS
jgi:hypothetical protein